MVVHIIRLYYKRFTVSWYTYNGKVFEIYTITTGFDYNNIPEDTELGLNKILEDYNNPTFYTSYQRIAIFKHSFRYLCPLIKN
jgi:hypothetical protein